MQSLTGQRMPAATWKATPTTQPCSSMPHLQRWLVKHFGAVAGEQHGTLAPLLDDAPLRAAAGAAQHRLHGCVWVTVPSDSRALLLHESQALVLCSSCLSSGCG